jgi:hypothetical protein
LFSHGSVCPREAKLAADGRWLNSRLCGKV